MISEPLVFTFESVVRTGAPPPPPPAFPWLGLALGGLALVAAAVLARRRAGRSAPPPPRTARILLAALTGAAGLTLMLTPDFAAADTPFVPLAAPVMLAHFGGLSVIAAMLLGTADLLLDAFRPQRTRTWLAIAPPLLTAFMVATLAGAGWLEPVSFPPDAMQLMLALAALAAGLTWWSHLPAPERRA